MYLGFQGLQVLAERLPLGAVLAIGKGLGTLAYVLLGRYRRLAMAQLKLSLDPTTSASRIKAITRGVFQNLALNVVEWLRLPRYSNRDVQNLITCDGIEHIRNAMKKGNGAIVVSAHFGNWEMIAVYLSTLGFQGGVLARRLRYPEYESFLLSMRGDKGVPTIARGGLKDVARLLRANQIIGLMPDQDVDSLEGVFVNFFGRPAYTPVGPAALSVMTGAPIIPCFMLREGNRFRLKIEPPIKPPQTRDRNQALVLLTQAWSDVVESYIRRFPEHWVWMHPRWKTQQANPTGATQEASTHPYRSSMGQVSTSAIQPVISLIVVLALTVLTGCGKSSGPTGTAAQEIDGAKRTAAGVERSMDVFALAGYNADGTKSWDLTGTTASISGDILTVMEPNGIGYDGEFTSYLTASSAQVNQINKHVRLEHDVKIHTSEGLWLMAPILHWIPDDNLMATSTAVRIETDHMLVRGYGFEGLAQLRYAKVIDDITVILNPSEEDKPGGPNHVKITCDGPLSFDYNRNIVTFEENVHVIDPKGDIFSDKLVVFMNEESHTIRYAEAIGNVRIVQGSNIARGNRAIYEPSNGKVTLIGQPSLLVNSDGSTTLTPSIAMEPVDRASEKR